MGVDDSGVMGDSVGLGRVAVMSDEIQVMEGSLQMVSDPQALSQEQHLWMRRHYSFAELRDLVALLKEHPQGLRPKSNADIDKRGIKMTRWHRRIRPKASESGQGESVFILFLIVCFIVVVWAAKISWDNITPSRIIFAGKVINSTTGEWPNNRLVLVFLKGNEIDRSVTSLGGFSESSQGKHDGLFSIEVENVYDLTRKTLNSENDIAFEYNNGGLFGEDFLYQWLDEIEEGGVHTISVPSKNIMYSIRVVQGELDTLPQELLVPGSATLRGGDTIVVALQDTPSEQLLSDMDVEISEVNYSPSSEIVEVNKITVPINNCEGSAPISQKYIQTQTFIRQYHAEAQAGVGAHLPVFAWLKLVPELQAKFGFEQGQVDTRTVEYNMIVEPHTSVAYVITWQEVWESGTANVVSGNDIIIIPFKVKSNLIYQVDSQKLGCD